MIGRAAIALICVAAPAALALGYWQGQSSELDVPMTPLPISAPLIAKPGEGAADAVRYLATVNVGARPATPAASPAPKADPGPPQPDIAVQFRRDVTAVLTGDEPHVVLSGGKQLGAGEIYRDGWKIRDLSGQHATLTKGSERRDVDLFSAPPMQTQVATSTTPLLTGPIELTNGMSPEQRNAAMQAQRTAMMQMLQQQLQGILPPGAQIRPNGAGFPGPGGFGGPQGGGQFFRPGGGNGGRGGRQGADAQPRTPATTPDSENRQPQ